MPPTTSSLNSPVEGHASQSPFEETRGDERDSLFLGIYSKAKLFGRARTIDQEELWRREDEVTNVVFWIVNGLHHLVEKREGKKESIRRNFGGEKMK